MSDTVLPTHEALLKLLRGRGTETVVSEGMRASVGSAPGYLDLPLNELRLKGLIRLTDWEPGLGQGYVLTEFGEEVFEKPSYLAELRAGTSAGLPTGVDEANQSPGDVEPTAYERGKRSASPFFIRSRRR